MYATKKQHMVELRTISILELNNIVIGIYTNNLAAYQSLKARIPVQLQSNLVSYSTVNRHVHASGTSYDIPTPLGIYVIKKTLLLKKAA